MNSVTMTGRLTRDPDPKHAGDRAVCEMRIAVPNGRHPTTYVDIAASGGQAYACAEFLAKGATSASTGNWRSASGATTPGAGTSATP